MKRVLILFVSLCIVYATWAESMDIRSLHHLSNTMEHKEFVEMAITHDSLTRSITTAQWYEELNLISTDTISMQLLPTLYDLIADRYYDQFGKNRDSVLSAWQAFHADDASPLPRLYIQLTEGHTSLRKNTRNSILRSPQGGNADMSSHGTSPIATMSRFITICVNIWSNSRPRLLCRNCFTASRSANR